MYLKYPRMFFFFLTTALSIVTFALASWGLATGEDNKKQARETLPGATLHIGDALGSGGGVTAAAGIASLLCLAGLFLLIFKHNRPETIKTVRMKEAAFAFGVILWLATLIPATVIFATRSGRITAPGLPDSIIAGLVAASGKNLSYSSQTPIKAYIAVGWVAFLSTLINLILVSLEARHVLKHGPAGIDGTQGELVGHRNENGTIHSSGSPTSIDEKKLSGEHHHEHTTTGSRGVEKGIIVDRGDVGNTSAEMNV